MSASKYQPLFIAIMILYAFFYGEHQGDSIRKGIVTYLMTSHETH